jgi:hypothetical protein
LLTGIKTNTLCSDSDAFTNPAHTTATTEHCFDGLATLMGLLQAGTGVLLMVFTATCCGCGEKEAAEPRHRPSQAEKDEYRLTASAIVSTEED